MDERSKVSSAGYVIVCDQLHVAFGIEPDLKEAEKLALRLSMASMKRKEDCIYAVVPLLMPSEAITEMRKGESKPGEWTDRGYL